MPKQPFWIGFMFILINLSTGCLSPNRLLPEKPPTVHHPVRLKHTFTENGTKTKAVLVPTPCPQIRNAQGYFNPEINFGCATDYNLAMMIADPQDLIPHQRPRMQYAAKPLGQAVTRSERAQNSVSVSVSNQPSSLNVLTDGLSSNRLGY